MFAYVQLMVKQSSYAFNLPFCLVEGYGVFVDEDISRGDFLLEYYGKLISAKEADEIADQTFVYFFQLQGKTHA